MPALMIDSDDPAVLLEPRFANIRIATYADLVTPQIVTQAAGRLAVIDRGLGDPHNIATIADIEPGCLSLADGVAKIRQWESERRPFPTVYHDRAIWEQVNNALDGVAYHHWVATLDGTLVPSGYYMAAVQFAKAATLGFHADMSIIWDDGWNPLPAGLPAAKLADLEHTAAIVGLGASQLAAMIRAL